MKKILSLFTAAFLSAASQIFAGLITSVPGPDDQGGMLMPMVTITNADDVMNPAMGTIVINFNPASIPILRPLQEWSPGDWFAETAAWRQDLGSAAGIGGTPIANAGDGDLFNSQYGFMFMSHPNPMMGMANIPTGKSLGIKLSAVSSNLLESYNYVNAENRWDQVFSNVGDQVLWNGTMWHNYFTLPSSALAGTYTASFEIFIANEGFTGSTGFAQYDAAALNAAKDNNFTSAIINYSWTVVPEPGSYFLLGVGLLIMAALGRKVITTSTCD